MNGPEADAGDDALLADVARMLRDRTEPPREVVEAAKELFTWRSVDAEIAALTADSLLDAEPVGARSAAQPRILTFETGDVVIEVEIDAGPGRRRLLGQLVPAQAAELELRSDGGGPGPGQPNTGSADDLGRFVLALPVGQGWASLRVRLGSGQVVDSAWVQL